MRIDTETTIYTIALDDIERDLADIARRLGELYDAIFVIDEPSPVDLVALDRALALADGLFALGFSP